MQAALGDVMQQKSGSVTYQKVDDAYFEARGLKRHAGVWLLWALGVGAVISGHFSGWNLGLASGGWGGMLVATILIAVMYLGLTFSLAEMSPAMPHTGGAYSFARTAFGPWGGFLTGLAENVEYVMTAAVIVFFIGTYGAAIVGAPVEMQPLFWVAGLCAVRRAELPRRRAVAEVLADHHRAGAALPRGLLRQRHPRISTSHRWALNIAPDGTELPEGNGPLFPFGLYGVLAALPFAVWLFLAIEQLPLAAEESVDPKRDMPKGIMLGMFTLMVSAFLRAVPQPVGDRRRVVQARHLGRAAARRFPRHLWRGLRQRSGARRRDRARRQLSTPSSSPTGGRSIRCRAPAISRARCR